MDLHAIRRGGHAPSLVAALLHLDVSFMAWVLLGALGDELELSASATGLMVAVPLLSAALFRVALGLLGDRYGPRHQGLAMGRAGAGNSGTVLTTPAGARV